MRESQIGPLSLFMALEGRLHRGGGDGPAGFGFLRLMSRREGGGPARDDGVCLTTVTGPLGP